MLKNNNNDFINKIRLILQDKGLSQNELALNLSVSKQYISQLMNSKREITDSFICKLRKAYPEYFKVNVIVPNVLAPEDLIRIRNKFNYSQSQFAEKINVSQSLYSKMERGERTITKEVTTRIKLFCSAPVEKPVNTKPIRRLDAIEISFCPDIKLPANGHIISNSKATVVIDRTLLFSDTCLNIRPSHCKVVEVSGRSLEPFYYQGDRFILDTSFRSFKDGYAFAFLYKHQCYIKNIFIYPDKIKCTWFDDADTFYLSDTKDVIILGLVVPRIRF